MKNRLLLSSQPASNTHCPSLNRSLSHKAKHYPRNASLMNAISYRQRSRYGRNHVRMLPCLRFLLLVAAPDPLQPMSTGRTVHPSLLRETQRGRSLHHLRIDIPAHMWHDRLHRTMARIYHPAPRRSPRVPHYPACPQARTPGRMHAQTVQVPHHHGVHSTHAPVRLHALSRRSVMSALVEPDWLTVYVRYSQGVIRRVILSGSRYFFIRL